MNDNKVIILGGGISGLTSGIYALKNGYKAVIYEKNSDIGGLSLSLGNKKNIINNYLYFITGKDNGDVSNFWKELGLKFNKIENDYFLKYKNIYIYKNLEKLEEELIKKAPEDFKIIKEFIKLIISSKKCSLNINKPEDILNIFEQTKLGFTHAHTIKLVNNYSNISIEDYLSSFKNEDVKEALLSILPSFYPVYLLFMILGAYTNDAIIKIKENSIDLITKLKDYFISLGGEIYTNKNAQTIDLYRGKAQGIWFDNKIYVNCNYIICAMDAHYVYDQLLQKKYNDRKFTLRFEDYKNYPLISNISFNYSIKENIDSLPDMFIINTHSFKIVNNIINTIKVFKNNGYLTCNILLKENDYKYLKILNNNKSVYVKEINNINDKISLEINNYLSDALEKKNIKINLILLKTPIDYEENYNTYNGSLYSFALTKEGRIIKHNGKIKDISNIYLASQWQSALGGILLAAVNGKFAVQRMIYDDKLLFKKRKEEK